MIYYVSISCGCCLSKKIIINNYNKIIIYLLLFFFIFLAVFFHILSHILFVLFFHVLSIFFIHISMFFSIVVMIFTNFFNCLLRFADNYNVFSYRNLLKEEFIIINIMTYNIFDVENCANKML